MMFLRSFLIYGVAGALSRLAAIVLVPLYTRTLSISEYGELEILLAVYALAVLVIGIQSESAIARDFHEMKGDRARSEMIWSGLGIAALGTLVVSLLALGAYLSGALPAFVYSRLTVLVAIGIPAQLLGIQLVLLRFAARPVLYAAVSFADLTLAAIFSALLIVQYDWGIDGALAGLGLSKLLLTLIVWPLTFGRMTISGKQRAHSRRMLAYALPTMPAVLLNWVQTLGSRLVLAFFFGVTGVAVVGVGLKVAALFGFLTYAFRLVWEPYSFERLARDDDPQSDFARMLNLYLVGMFVFAGITAIASRIVVAILAPPQYASAAPLVGALIFAQYWVGATAITSIGIHAARVTWKLSVVYLLSTVVILAVLAVLTPYLGLTAAAIAIFAGSLFGAFQSMVYTKRHAGIHFDLAALCAAAILSALLALAAYGLFAGIVVQGAPPIRVGIGYAMALAVTALAALWLARIALGPLRLIRLADVLRDLKRSAKP